MADKETSQEQAARRIQALLAMAEDAAAKGNEELRNTYLEKAAALQIKYAVEAAMLQKESNEPISFADFCRESNTQLVKAKRALINVVSNHNRGKAVMFSEWQKDKAGNSKLNKRAYIRVYAYESDLRFISTLYTSLILQMQSMMARDERQEQLCAYRGATPASWRVSYAHAWVDRIAARLRDMEASGTQEAEKATPGSALVLADRGKQVIDHVTGQLGKLGSSRAPRSDNNAAGRSAGWQAGGRADLGQKPIQS